MNLGNRRIGKYKIKDIFSPRNWFAMLDSWVAKRYVDLDYMEQVVLRAWTQPCRTNCLMKGECVDCKCQLPETMMARDKYCSEGHWDVMLSKEDWIEFKKESKLKIEARYGD